MYIYNFIFYQNSDTYIDNSSNNSILYFENDSWNFHEFCLQNC